MPKRARTKSLPIHSGKSTTEFLDARQEWLLAVKGVFEEDASNSGGICEALARLYKIAWNSFSKPVAPEIITLVEKCGIQFEWQNISWLVQFAAQDTGFPAGKIEEYGYLLDSALQSGVAVVDMRDWLISRIADAGQFVRDGQSDSGRPMEDGAVDLAGNGQASPTPTNESYKIEQSSSLNSSARTENDEGARALVHHERSAVASQAEASRSVGSFEPEQTHAHALILTSAEQAQQTAGLETAVTTKCFVQNILGSTEFEEGRPIRQDFDRERFAELFEEAQRLEAEIVEIERELDGGEKDRRSRLDPKVVEMATRVFEMAHLVHSGILPQQVMEEFVAKAGIRPDKRDKYIWSPLVRAVGASVEIKGTRPTRPTQARRSTSAAALHTAISTDMTADDFRRELTHLPVRGEKHGLYHLAAQARNEKRASDQSKLANEMAETLADLDKGGAYRVLGDFSCVDSGFHLVVIKLPEHRTAVTETFGQIVEPENDALVQRLLAELDQKPT